jgi:glutamyl-tRNA synthetase
MTFARLQSSPAIFDQPRLDYLNGVWLRRLPVAELASRIRDFLPAADDGQLVPIAAMVQERIRRLDEVPKLLAFAFSEPAPTADALCGRLSPPPARAFLERALGPIAGDLSQLLDRLRETARELHREFDPQAERTEKKFVQDAMQVLRVAITGETVSPPLTDSIALIGAEKARARVNRALEILAP